jgi:CubicO group peptidase (beta-lactamase class C family)
MNKIFLNLAFLIFLGSTGCLRENPGPDAGVLRYTTPGELGLSEETLLTLHEEVSAGKFGDIHSLLILQHGDILYEHYYNGHSRDELHPLGAATKSIVSALFGTLYSTRDSISLTTPIIDLFPEYPQYFFDIPQKDKLQISHLLGNRSGLRWDEWTHPFGNPENDAYAMSTSDLWVEQVLSVPMTREPGFEFNYNSGNAILMAPIIEKLAGGPLEPYADSALFAPLGITEWFWEKMPDGYPNTAWGLHMRTIDLAKIGQLYINNGRYGDTQIFPDTWAGRSTRSRSQVTSYYNYGYQWWRFSNNADVLSTLQKRQMFFAWGEGGQFIFVAPEHDLVIVTTAGNYNNDELQAYEMLRDYIFKALPYIFL